jgi:methionine aminopeptidase
MATQKSSSAAELKDAILDIVSTANDPGTSRTEMLDAFDSIIETAEGVYPGVLDEAESSVDEDDSDDDDED